MTDAQKLTAFVAVMAAIVLLFVVRPNIVVLGIIALIGISAAGFPWLFMITVGVAYHNWGWPSATLSYVESIPFSMFFLTFIVSTRANSSS